MTNKKKKQKKELSDLYNENKDNKITVKLLFLDVDGVLNFKGYNNTKGLFVCLFLFCRSKTEKQKQT